MTVMTAALLPFIEVNMLHHPCKRRYHAFKPTCTFRWMVYLQTTEVHPSRGLKCGEEILRVSRKVFHRKSESGPTKYWIVQTLGSRRPELCGSFAQLAPWRNPRSELMVSSLNRSNQASCRIFSGAKAHVVRVLPVIAPGTCSCRWMIKWTQTKSFLASSLFKNFLNCVCVSSLDVIMKYISASP